MGMGSIFFHIKDCAAGNIVLFPDFVLENMVAVSFEFYNLFSKLLGYVVVAHKITIASMSEHTETMSPIVVI